MKFPIQIMFRNMDSSIAVEDKVLKHAEKLERYSNHIIECDVVIESNHRHHYKGKLYHVRIDLTVPDAKLVASREPSEHHAHEDVYVAIRDAFDAIKRQLQDYIDIRRGAVKHHQKLPQGRVREIAPLADYGYIETPDGQQVLFTSNSVIGYDFNKLEVGDLVRFNTIIGEEGLTASTVHVEHHG